MRVTMGQIAKEAGVSQATVSRVLSGRSVGFISDATRQHVRHVATELGFEFVDAAVSPGHVPRGRSGVVSVWVGWAMDEQTVRLVGAVVETAWSSGYETLIRPLISPKEGQRRASFAWPVDGILAVGTAAVEALLEHQAGVRKIKRRSRPAPNSASVLSVRGRLVPVVILGADAGSSGMYCPPAFDAVRCNPDGEGGKACRTAESLSDAAWTRLRSRIIGRIENDAPRTNTEHPDSAHGVHVWVSPDDAARDDVGERGEEKTPSDRHKSVVKPSTRLQSADAELI